MDQLTLYQGALRLCAERKLSGLSENREPRRLLDDVWAEDVVKTCLEEGLWQFATDSARIDYDPDITPQFGYRRAFQKPEHYVRTVALSANEFFDPPLTAFRDEGNIIYADLDTIYMSFVSDADDFGRDMSKWPQSFSKFVMAELALEINPRLTNATVKTDVIRNERKKRLSEAQGKDGSNRPTYFMPRGSWVNARLGSAPYRDPRRR